MPLKGQKFKRYSIEEKETVIEEYNKGISSTHLVFQIVLLDNG